MGQVTYTFRIDAPPEAVYEVGSKLERLPEWNTSVTEVKDFSGPPDQAGSSYTAVSKIGGRPLEVRWEVVKVEKPFYGEMKGTAPGGGWALYTFKNEAMGMGTEATIELRYELPGGFLGLFADKLFVERAIERDVKHSCENFKAIVEAEIPAHV